MAVLGDLFADLSREVNDIMTAAVGFLEPYKQAGSAHPPIPNPRPTLEQVRTMVSELASSLLCFCSPVEPTRGLVNEAVEAAVQLYFHRQRRGVRFKWTVDPGLPPVDISTGQLQLILASMIKNALNAVVGQASPLIRIATGLADGFVSVGVWNSGPVVAKKPIARLVGSGRSNRLLEVNTGLGLAVASRVVSRAGGYMTVRSVDDGLVSMLRLPVTARVPLLPEPALPERGALKGRRVLVVDDDPTTRSVCELVLREMHQGQVRCCGSGLEALEVLGVERFDAMVLDLWMPGLSGEDVYLRMPKHTRKTVVFVTGAALWSMTNSFLDFTGQPALFKPMTAASLVRAVHKVIAAAPAQRASKAAAMAVH